MGKAKRNMLNQTTGGSLGLSNKPILSHHGNTSNKKRNSAGWPSLRELCFCLQRNVSRVKTMQSQPGQQKLAFHKAKKENKGFAETAYSKGWCSSANYHSHFPLKGISLSKKHKGSLWKWWKQMWSMVKSPKGLYKTFSGNSSVLQHVEF